ncbi:PQQ-dependent sugar dehydrogenase [Candidatus Roizmanbacteria bacterium]|nr:PQQ-dependent sugar dehydrogenase [Candidatus Roizmanbacteria bacterium]
MKNFFLLILILILAAFFLTKNVKKNKSTSIIPSQIPSLEKGEESEVSLVTTIAEGLDTPWAIAFLPDGDMLVTERPGRVRYIDKKGELAQEPVATLDQVKEIGEGGLLGIALHPNFSSNKYVYFYYTFSGKGEDTLNRVVRMKYENDKLSGEEIIVDNIPGNFNHNGGRIKFGPDKNLYITTGDAQNPSHAQDKASLAGKILRVTDTGKLVSDSPFNNLTYSYGHRNPQGIDWDKTGRLWSTEHGSSRFDELNLIERGKNYGWPDIRGDQEQSGMVKPMIHSGAIITWAPAGAAFVDESLFFAGLRGQTLYQAVINGDNVTIKEHFKGQFGRLREVIMGPDKMLYITTSNQDGRGNPDPTDDRVIRVNPNKL